MGTFIYLAGPYSDPNPRVRKAREAQITKLTALLVDAGLHVYSPLTHTAPLERLGVKKGGHEWLLFDRPMMDAAAFLIVATFPNWEQSVGVQEEIKYFRQAKKPVFFLSPDMGEGTVFTTWDPGFR